MIRIPSKCLSVSTHGSTVTNLTTEHQVLTIIITIIIMTKHSKYIDLYTILITIGYDPVAVYIL
jgi:hypothetical protein